jgi:hypothetical protein
MDYFKNAIRINSKSSTSSYRRCFYNKSDHEAEKYYDSASGRAAFSQRLSGRRRYSITGRSIQAIVQTIAQTGGNTTGPCTTISRIRVQAADYKPLRAVRKASALPERQVLLVNSAD